MINYFSHKYEGKRVIIFGHTGFKGSWLTLWLSLLGAKIVGVSRDIPTNPSHFDEARVKDICESIFIDIRDLQGMKSLVSDIKPDFVFHLAAQSLVHRAYREPVETFSTNVLGTVNVLESLRHLEHECIAIIVTSDKCYENVEVVDGYKETDRLGGKDPYSASKSAAELAIRGYLKSFFQTPDNPIKIAIGRAGNVIGGGDWAGKRLVPDFVRSWKEAKTLEIRQPRSTRPWQHVMEPLSGYLWLGSELARRPTLHGEPFNFGPRTEDIATVAKVVDILSNTLEGACYEDISGRTNSAFQEAGLLNLSCDKALYDLKWQTVYSLQEALDETAIWYRHYYQQSIDIRALTMTQIEKYCGLAASRGRVWTC